MSVRHLAGTCSIGGASFRVQSMDVNQTANKSADTMHAEVALSSPGAKALIGASDLTLEASIEAGSDSGLLFTGTVDNITADFDRMTLKVSGRDKTKGPIGKKSIEDFRNKTPIEIVREVAGRHGLSVLTEGAGSMMAGKKQQKEDFVHLTHHISDWTLIQHLADREGKVAFVRKDQLYFVPIDSGMFGAFKVVFVPPTPGRHAVSNVLQLSCSRNMEAGQPTEVTVRSWNTKKAEAYEGKSRGNNQANNGSISGGGERKLEYSHPQLDQDQAQNIADKRHREAVRHEMSCNVTMPGKASVQPPMKLNLSGTGTAFDQTYYIDTVAHRVAGGGYTMAIAAKNTKGGGGGEGGEGSEDVGDGEPVASSSGGSRGNSANNGSISGGA
jgi:phage protein D